MPLRLLVAPLLDARLAGSTAEVGSTVTDAAGGAEREGGAESDTVAVPQFDVERFRGELARALGVAKVCARLDKAPPLSAEKAAAVVKDEAARAAFDKETLSDAAKRKYDLVLELRLLKYDLRFFGSTEYAGRHLMSILAFLNWYFPSWWIADAEFGCELELEASLLAVGSERRVIDRKVYRGQCRRVLDQFERGLTWLGPLFLRSSLDEENWSQVAQMVAPPARAEVWSALAADLKAVDPEAPALRARYLVSVGAGHFGQRHEALLQAEEDAKAFHDLWVGEGVVPRKNAQLLLGGAATEVAILKALRSALERARPRDLVCLYFAGYGASVAGRPALVSAAPPGASRSGTGAGGRLTLAALAKVLDAGRSRQAVVLDASFLASSEKGVRSFSRQAGSAGALHADAFQGLRRPGRVWVFGGGRRGFSRSTELANGTFTGFLLENARSRTAKARRDGLVTLNDLFSKIRSDVREEPFDPPQSPEWWGAARGPSDPSEVVVPLLVRSQAVSTAAKRGGAER